MRFKRLLGCLARHSTNGINKTIPNILNIHHEKSTDVIYQKRNARTLYIWLWDGSLDAFFVKTKRETITRIIFAWELGCFLAKTSRETFSHHLQI